LDIGIAADSPAAIWVIRDAGSSAEWLPVAGESDGIISPTAIRFSGDTGLRIATATGVTLIQLSDNSRSDLRCGCRPTTLVEMETDSTYRLTQLSREPMWLLHESSEGPRLVFVPPVAAPQTTEGAQ
jgi:hypothetical protein